MCLRDSVRAAGTYTGKEPFNFAVAVLFPAAQVSGAAPQAVSYTHLGA